ncbi:tyrosine-type recombinase/integrase [Microbacterium sp. NPDC057407]|uniref:tyrosine-type recombinase/integrase n=1 Tax=Microbacterium sp. NPDC057407 TaxID=3346120 RepID=UPI00366BED6F
MAGRPRTPIGTFGEISIREIAPGRARAATRFGDWGGQARQVSATADSRHAAGAELKARLAERQQQAAVGSLSASSSFRDLAAAWQEDMLMNADLSEGTKETYGRELRTLVMPTFAHLAVQEITVGRVERFLKVQRAKSYPQMKHSRTILGMVMSFAVRREIIPRNPVKDTSRMKKPKNIPKALTDEQLALIWRAAREWRTREHLFGPRPDGQVRDVIEVMLGTATRIGEVLAIRKCDLDMTARPPRVDINGTLVVRTGAGVIRQAKPKSDKSNRIVAIPAFAAEVIRARLARIGGASDDHLLFFTRNGTPLAPHNVRGSFRGMLESVGLDGTDNTPHAFRRTGATLMANEVDMAAAAEMLGHSSPAITRAHYAEPYRKVDPRSAQVMQRLAPENS